MEKLQDQHISQNVAAFLEIGADGQSTLTSRTRSWDFCFNYFQSTPNPTQDLQMSCLQLGYYLASWGMLRGSSYLFTQTNARHYSAAVEIIERHNPNLRGLDVRDYADPDARRIILSAYADLRKALLPLGGAHTTLVSKAMMGVWGIVPSFDTYFIKGFRRLAKDRKEQTTFRTVSNASLILLGRFYSDHKAEIVTLSRQHTTLDFATGSLSSRRVTEAKVLDMFGFTAGYRDQTFAQG